MQLLGCRNRSQRKRGAVPQLSSFRKPAVASCCVQEQRAVERLQSDAPLRGAGLSVESNIEPADQIRRCWQQFEIRFQGPAATDCERSFASLLSVSFPFPFQEPVGRWTAAGRLRQRQLSFLRRLPALVPVCPLSIALYPIEGVNHRPLV